MTIEDTIRMAREAGLVPGPSPTSMLERFAAIVEAKAAASEREVCILELERNADKALDEIIAAIRARGEKK